MATLTKYPTGNSSNSWNNPSYAYVTSDTQYADCTPAVSGGTVSGDWGTFDFSAIPAGSTINDVYMQHSTWKTSGSRSGFRVDLEMYDGSTKIGSTVTGSELGSSTYPAAITADQGTHPTLAQLQSANFKVRVIGVNTNTKYTLGIDMDYVRVYVDYTAPSAKDGGTQTIYAVADADHSSTQPVRIRRVANAGTHSAAVDVDHKTTLDNRIRRPYNICYSPGVTVQACESSADWTPNSGSSVANDSTYFVAGTQSVKLTSASGAYSYMGATIDLDATDHKLVHFAFYIHDITKIDAVQIQLANDSGWTQYWSRYLTVAAGLIRQGWNRIYLKPGDFAGTGSPTWTTFVRIRLSLQAASGQIGEVSFDDVRSGLRHKPLCFISFDDTADDTYDTAYPIMAAEGIKGTAYITSSWVGYSGDYMSLSDLQTLYAAGWDIGIHGSTDHVAWTTLTEQEIEDRINACSSYLVSNGMPRAATHVAYPYGSRDSDSDTALGHTGMQTGRIASYYTYSLPQPGWERIPTYSLGSGTTLAQAQSYVDSAVQSGAVLGFLFHYFGDGGGSTEWTVSDFTTLMAYIADRMETVTISQLYEYGMGWCAQASETASGKSTTQRVTNAGTHSCVVDADHSTTLPRRVRRYNSVSNLVTNPGMVGDAGSDGVPDQWELLENIVGTPTLTLTDIGDGRYRWRAQYTAVSGDTNATIGIRMYTSGGTVEEGDIVLYRGLAVTNPANSGPVPYLSCYIRNVATTVLASVNASATSGVVKWYGLAAPTGAWYVELRLYIFAITNGGVVDITWELPAIYRNGEQIAYFDGDTSGCYWAGTQYNSRSVKTPPEVVVISSTASGGKIKRGVPALANAVVDLDHSATQPYKIRRGIVTAKDLVVDADAAQPTRFRPGYVAAQSLVVDADYSPLPTRIRRGYPDDEEEAPTAVVDADSTATVTKIRRGITTAQSLVVAHEAAGSKVSGEVRNGEADVSLCADADALQPGRLRGSLQTRLIGVQVYASPGEGLNNVFRIKRAGTQTVVACVDADTVARRVRAAGTATVSAPVDADVTVVGRLRKAGTQTVSACVDADSTATVTRTRKGITVAQSAVVVHSAAGTLLGVKSAGTQTIAAVSDCDHASTQPLRIRRPGTQTLVAVVDADTTANKVRLGTTLAQSAVAAQGSVTGTRTRLATPDAKYAVVDADYAPLPVRIRKPAAVPQIAAVVVGGAIGGEVGKATAVAVAVVDADTPQPTRTRIVGSAGTHSAAVDADTTALRIKRSGTQTVSLVVDADTTALRIKRAGTQTVSACVDCDYSPLPTRIRRGLVQAISAPVDADIGTARRLRLGSVSAKSLVVDADAGTPIKIRRGTTVAQSTVVTHSASGSKLGTKNGAANVSLCVDADSGQPRRTRGAGTVSRSLVVDADGNALRLKRPGSFAVSTVVSHSAGARRVRGCTIAAQSGVVTHTAGARRTRGAGTALRSAVVTITGSGSTGVTTKTAGTRSLGAVVTASSSPHRVRTTTVARSCHVTIAEYGSYAPPIPAGRLERERPPLWIKDFKRTGSLR